MANKVCVRDYGFVSTSFVSPTQAATGAKPYGVVHFRPTCSESPVLVSKPVESDKDIFGMVVCFGFWGGLFFLIAALNLLAYGLTLLGL